MISKRFYTGFDLIKLIAAISIIGIHTHAPFLNIIGRLGVPFFAIVSSVLFFSHYQQLSSYNSQQTYLRKFCRRIFLLYVTWQVLYIPLAIRQFRVIMSALGGISIKNLSIYIIDFFFPAIYNSQGIDLTRDANGWGPSWYLLASIIAMPVLVYLLRAFHYRIRPVFFLCLLIEVYIVFSDEFSKWTHFSPLLNHTFLRLLIYFCLGYVIVSYSKQIDSWSMHQILRLFSLFLCLFIAEYLLLHYFGGSYDVEEVITTVPTGFLLTLVAIKIRPALHHPVQVRNLSTFLYCFQIWPIVILRKVFEIVGWEKYYIALFILVMIFSLLAAFIYEKCRQRYGGRFLKYMV